MLRHTGAHRTPSHNLRLAVLLCTTAGFVNAEGFLGFGVLTTNVTGHAAQLAESLAHNKIEKAGIVALWMLLFLAGAFISSIIISLSGKNKRYSYSIPLLVELGILASSAVEGLSFTGTTGAKEIFAGSLLFTMGLQNALVSIVSGSVVRTTHLTGTVTDLGIELAQLCTQQKAISPGIRSRINLRLVIIGFFLLGAVLGGYLFQKISFYSFFAPVLLIAVAVIYDVLRIKAFRYYHTRLNILQKYLNLRVNSR